MEYNNQKHADQLLELESLICYCMMVSEGLQPAGGQMGDRQFANTAIGAFGLMAFVLEKAYDIISDAEHDFRVSHGLQYAKDSEVSA